MAMLNNQRVIILKFPDVPSSPRMGGSGIVWRILYATSIHLYLEISLEAAVHHYFTYDKWHSVPLNKVSKSDMWELGSWMLGAAIPRTMHWFIITPMKSTIWGIPPFSDRPIWILMGIFMKQHEPTYFLSKSRATHFLRVDPVEVQSLLVQGCCLGFSPALLLWSI